VSSTYLILVRTPLLCVWCSIRLALGTPQTEFTNLSFLFRQLRSANKRGGDQYASGGY
jgi:hypothetical protein